MTDLTRVIDERFVARLADHVDGEGKLVRAIVGLTPLVDRDVVLVDGGPVLARALAADPQFSIALKAHQFIPKDLQIPAGQTVELRVHNTDPTPAEFESISLHREEVVVGGGEIRVFVGPLDAGRYEFFDDFHPETRGTLIVK